MNEVAEHHAPDDVGGAENQGSDPKSRPIYNKSTSEATRELRDTSRRRRDAEVKLQQHLIQAKDHVPHHHDRDMPQADEDPAADGRDVQEQEARHQDAGADGPDAQDRDGGTQLPEK